MNHPGLNGSQILYTFSFLIHKLFFHTTEKWMTHNVIHFSMMYKNLSYFSIKADSKIFLFSVKCDILLIDKS